MALSTLRPPAAFASLTVLLRPFQTSAAPSAPLPLPVAAVRMLSASAGPRPYERRLPPLQAVDSSRPTSRLPSVPRPRHLEAAGFMGSLPHTAATIPQLGPRPHARRLPPPRSAYSGHAPTTPTTRLSIVPQPRRIQAAEFLVRPRSSAAEARHPLPPHVVNPNQPAETQGPTSPWRRLWRRAAAMGSSKSSPVRHFSLAVLFYLIKCPAFGEIVKGMSSRFRFSPKLTLNIILGASVISAVYDLAMGGKDLDDICDYLRRLEKPDTPSGDQQQG